MAPYRAYDTMVSTHPTHPNVYVITCSRCMGRVALPHAIDRDDARHHAYRSGWLEESMDPERLVCPKCANAPKTISLFHAAKALIDNVKARFPGEDLYCPYMRDLDAAVKKEEIRRSDEIQYTGYRGKPGFPHKL